MITGKQIHKYYGVSASTSVTFGVYVGFQEINGIKAMTKIGRTNNAAALSRGRNQGGANWWFAGFYPLPSNEETRVIEKIIKTELKPWNVTGQQGQIELYHLSIEEACELVEEILEEEGYNNVKIDLASSSKIYYNNRVSCQKGLTI